MRYTEPSFTSDEVREMIEHFEECRAEDRPLPYDGEWVAELAAERGVELPTGFRTDLRAG